MGMTNEFGHRKASLPLPVRLDTEQQMRGPDSSSNAPSQAYKLPVEILSADSNVYDPFDSSDSAEFFSSEASDSDSDYDSHGSQEGYAEDGNVSLDDDSEEGIVFGAAAQQVVLPSNDEHLLPIELPSIGLPANSIGRSSRHGRKGTLGEINFSYDEKDEERELAKTAGTPAFFAPELCCTTEELAIVLRAERAKRRACSKGALRHRHNTDPLAAASIPSQRCVGNEQSSGHKIARVNSRPTSLYIESSTVGSSHDLRGASAPGCDTQQRTPSNPKSMKRHSMLTSLLARPFSARSRSSANNTNSNRSSTNEGQLGDVDAALDGMEKADMGAGPNSPGSGSGEAFSNERPAGSEGEELPSNVITPAIDIWAMGVTLYCLIYGRVPFQATTEFELFNIIPHKQIEFPDYLEVDDDDDKVSGAFDGLLFNPSRNKNSKVADASLSSRGSGKRR
ncbi:hypothetical protein GGI23_006936, partial [Coemansia sp. RSA 2559]